MRDIIFKGKRVDNGEWVYGYYFKATHHWHNHGIHKDWIATDTVQNGGWCNVRGKYAVLPETVGQYTGLTDKNGKKIWEGDIVIKIGKIQIDDKTFEDGIKEKGVVGFKFGCFALLDNYKDDKSGGTLFIAPKYESYEVIGNVFDNPELLEVK